MTRLDFNFKCVACGTFHGWSVPTSDLPNFLEAFLFDDKHDDPETRQTLVSLKAMMCELPHRFGIVMLNQDESGAWTASHDCKGCGAVVQAVGATQQHWGI